MITISERLRARQEPVGDGSGRWRKDGLCQEAADIIDALTVALDDAKEALDDWVRQYAPEHCGENHVVETWRRISAYGGTLAYIANIQDRNRNALAKAKGKQE